MNSKICPRCGFQNPPNMSFCSNCGQSLAIAPESGGNVSQGNPSEPPPTVLSYQPNIPASPAPQNFQQPSPHMQQPPSPAASPPKKGNKGLLFGLLGCGGLLLASLIGLAVGIPLLQRAGVLPQPLFGGTRRIYDSNLYNTNTTNTNSTGVTNNRSGSTLLTELQGLKQVGEFRQTEVKTVPAKDFFPSATEAVQATYTNGSKYVATTSGKFSSNDAAFSDFNTQIKNVKDGGGTIYSNESKNGTQAAAYKYKNFYFIEACGQSVCTRNNSNDVNALRSFTTSYSAALSGSSKFN